MSEPNKYDEDLRRQMSDLPLPDMEGAWQHMKRKLDDEDKKRRILPPFVLNCLGVLLALVLLGGGWYFLSEQNLSSLQTSEQKTTQEAKPEKENNLPVGASPLSNQTIKTQPQTETTITQESSTRQAVSEPSVFNEPTGNDVSAKSTSTSASLIDGNSVAVDSKEISTTGVVKSSGTKAAVRQSSSLIQRGKNNKAAPLALISVKKKQKSVPVPEPEIKQTPTVPRKDETKPVSSGVIEGAPQNQNASSKTNAVKKADVGSDKVAAPKDSVSSLPEQKKEKKEKKIYFTAGLGLQQIIPLDGQSSVPYNKFGRTASLSDYLPSVWVRMHKGKWFLQGEFRYGAPQSVKEFSFAQRTKYDNATGDLSVTNTVLRKTYYHQLPLTLNYHVHKNISVGAGGMYSYFYGAVTQQEVRTQNTVTGQESFKTTIVPVRSFNDSFLYKTQVHLLLQADYHWRRFNLGLRYSTDLQPYIKYTMPDGNIRTEKNHSLQVFLRYRIFPLSP